MNTEDSSSGRREFRVLDDFAGYTRVEFNGWKLLIDGGMDEAADFCRMANKQLSAGWPKHPWVPDLRYIVENDPDFPCEVCKHDPLNEKVHCGPAQIVDEYQSVNSRLAAAESELADTKKQLAVLYARSETPGFIDQLLSELETARATIERLEEYATHQADPETGEPCGYYMTWKEPTPADCTCGLSSLLTALAGKE